MSPASTVQLGPLELGLWMPIPALARFYGLEERTLRRWAADGRLRCKDRPDRKGVLLWSEEVAELAGRDTRQPPMPRNGVGVR